MNITDHQAELVAKVQDLGAQLEQARADVALLRRLKAAEADEKRLTTALRAAQEELADVSAAAIQAQRDARFSRFVDITVAERLDPEKGPGLLHNSYEITLTQIVWDGRQSLPAERKYPGFGHLPEHGLDYLIEKHPERIPGTIMDLCPDDPWQAMDRYFVAKKRGWVKAA